MSLHVYIIHLAKKQLYAYELINVVVVVVVFVDIYASNYGSSEN